MEHFLLDVEKALGRGLDKQERDVAMSAYYIALRDELLLALEQARDKIMAIDALMEVAGEMSAGWDEGYDAIVRLIDKCRSGEIQPMSVHNDDNKGKISIVWCFGCGQSVMADGAVKHFGLQMDEYDDGEFWYCANCDANIVAAGV